MRSEVRAICRRPAVIVNAVYACTLVVLAVVPRSIGPKGFLISDGVAHAVAYGVQSVLLMWAVRSRWGVLTSVFLAVAGAVCFGLFTEVLQSMVPYRDFSGADLAADAVGAVIGAGFAVAIRIGAPEKVTDR